MNKRYFIFVSIVTFLLSVIWLVSFTELILPLNLSRPLLLVVAGFFIFTFSLQLFRLVRFKSSIENPKSILVTFIFLGLFIHLFCAAITKTLLLLLPPLAFWETQITGAFIFAAIVFNAKGMHTGFKGPKIKKISVNLPEIYDVLDGIKIVQVSDLHVGPVIQDSYVRPIAEKIKSVNPDIVVFTGDIGDGKSQLYADELRAFSDLAPSYGKYYVTGNHEHMWGAEEWIQSVERHGIQPLINKGVQITPSLFIGGVPDITSHHYGFESSDPKQAVEGGQGFKILLTHQPKSCHDAEQAGFDLMLSGHTHNGQFFPFNFLVGLFNPYTKGLNQHGKMQVYVNAGTGFWGPPLRLGVESEITLLTLTTKNQ